MICSNELKVGRMYSKNTKFLAPSIKEDTKHGSVIFMMTPNKEASFKVMNLPYMINRRQFESYYIEKSIDVLVNSSSSVKTESVDIEEAALSSKERNNLKDSTFGIPELRKYPLNDANHVHQAIQKFNFVDSKYESELASNIKKAMVKFGVTDIEVGDDNRFKKYMNEEVSYDAIFEDTFIHEYKVDNFGIVNNEHCIYIANDVVNEAQSTHDAKIKRLIYADRIRNNKIIADIYKEVKEANSFIKYTKYNVEMYKTRNLFVDTYYYNQSFISNNTFRNERGALLYLEFMTRLLDDSRFKKYTKKTLLIPVEEWHTPDTDIFDIKQSINPMSVIYFAIKRNHADLLEKCFGKFNVIFVGNNGYFREVLTEKDFTRQRLNKFVMNINRILSKEVIVPDEGEPIGDSKEAMATVIYNNIQDATGLKFTRKFTGDSSEMNEPDFEDEDDEDNEDNAESGNVNSLSDAEIEERKGQVEDIIDNVVAKSDSVEDLEVDELESRMLANLINDLARDTNSGGVNISAARSARMDELNAKFIDSGKVNGIAIKDLLKDAESAKVDETLEETELPINTINDGWKHLTFKNFEKAYNLDADIVSIIKYFSTTTYPVSVLDIDVQDTSNSEDYINTWTVKMEDAQGSRFSLVFDVPKFINGTRFMRLRGNDKTINGQLFNIPVIKSDRLTCQITSNYNKIFISPSTDNVGKCNPSCDRFLRALKANKDKNIVVEYGDNTRLSTKYELPNDYVDISKIYSRIRIPGAVIYLNQDEIYEKYGKLIETERAKQPAASRKHLFPWAILTRGTHEEVVFGSMNKSFFFTDEIVELIAQNVPSFKEVYNSTKISTSYAYSRCSILAAKIPLIVVAGYSVGLSAIMSKLGPENVSFVDNKNQHYDKNLYDEIKFADGAIRFKLTYSNAMLFYGLRACDTESYSITEIDNRAMWTDFLDNFGGRIKADGLDNFYDLMVDPITKRVCGVYNLPDDYIDQLLYANTLLSDTKFTKHTDVTSNRFRTNELVAAHAYKCLSKAYSDYSIQVKKQGQGKMSMKKSAIIDSILSDSTTSDLSANSDLSYVETANTLSFKGLSGLNCDRAYGIDKRAYDSTMLNLVAMNTGFAGNVGVNRNATINMGVNSSRGYIGNEVSDVKNMDVTNTLSISEALIPMSSTKDDPFRLAMAFIQNSKHSIPSQCGDPCLVTTGADDALAYLAPDVFNYKAKKNGVITQADDKHIVIEYKDGTHEVISLMPKIYKNSDGGFYLNIKLDKCPNVKVGMKVSENTIVAYHKGSYTPDIGFDDNPTANRGILGKVMFAMTDEGFEDSGMTSAYCENTLSRKVTVELEVVVDKNANVYDMVSVGTHVEQGENLLVIQNAFEDSDINTLLRRLTDEDAVSDLGRHPKKAKVTGDIVDIQIFRTCEFDEMSPTLQKIVGDYEKKVEAERKFLSGHDKFKAQTLQATGKLEPIGKMKNIEDGVRIVFYLEFITDFSSGDKLIVNGGNKCVTTATIKPGNESYTAFRPHEPIDCHTSINSNNARMITSNLNIGLCTKGLVELDRAIKGIMGLPVPDDIHEYLHPGQLHPDTYAKFHGDKK